MKQSNKALHLAIAFVGMRPDVIVLLGANSKSMKNTLTEKIINPIINIRCITARNNIFSFII